MDVDTRISVGNSLNWGGLFILSDVRSNHS